MRDDELSQFPMSLICVCFVVCSVCSVLLYVVCVPDVGLAPVPKCGPVPMQPKSTDANVLLRAVPTPPFRIKGYSEVTFGLTPTGWEPGLGTSPPLALPRRSVARGLEGVQPALLAPP